MIGTSSPRVLAPTPPLLAPVGFGLFGVAVALVSVWVAAHVLRGELSPLMGAVAVGGGLFIATSRYFPVVPLAAYAVLGSDEACKLIAPGAEHVTRLLGAGAVMLIFVRALLTKRLWMPHGSVWLFLVFGAWSAITVAWSIDLERSQDSLTTLAGLLLTLVLLSVSEISDDELRFLRKAVLVGASIVSAAAVIVYVSELTTLDWDVSQGLPRMSGDLPYGDWINLDIFSAGDWVNPNTLTASLFLPIALSMAGSGSVAGRASNVLALAVMLLAVLAAQSRAGIVAIVLMLLILAYRFKARMLGVVVVVGILVVTAWDLLLGLVARFSAEALLTGEGRTFIWGYALDALSEFWLSGSGIGTFTSISAELGLGAGRYATADAHNVYVQIAVELGVLGMLLFLVAMAVLIASLGRVSGRSETPFPPLCLQATLIGLLVYGAFHGLMRQKFFWLVIGLSTVILVRAPRAQEAVEPGSRPVSAQGLAW